MYISYMLIFSWWLIHYFVRLNQKLINMYQAGYLTMIILYLASWKSSKVIRNTVEQINPFSPVEK